MKSAQAWFVFMCLPALLLGAITGYATGAGCYAWTMNCFSITVGHDRVSRAVLFAAAFLPFALPAYLPVLVAGLAALWRRGRRGALAWIGLAPLLYAAAVHVSCLSFASWVLPERRVTPEVGLDLAVLAAGYAYAALAWLAVERLRLFQPRPSPWSRRALSSARE